MDALLACTGTAEAAPARRRALVRASVESDIVQGGAERRRGQRCRDQRPYISACQPYEVSEEMVELRSHRTGSRQGCTSRSRTSVLTEPSPTKMGHVRGNVLRHLAWSDGSWLGGRGDDLQLSLSSQARTGFGVRNRDLRDRGWKTTLRWRYRGKDIPDRTASQVSYSTARG